MKMCDRPAALMRDTVARIVDISPSGCLLESRRRLDAGTVGRIQLKFDNDECADDAEVVRCDAVEGARSVYLVRMRFLWTTPPDAGSIRHAVTRYADELESAYPLWVM